MDTHIWYFNNSRQGVIVASLDRFWITPTGVVEFHFKSGKTWMLRDEEDVRNFKENILRLD
jgi:hypothetical protein